VPSIEPTPRIVFCMITILILWGLGAYVVCGDLTTVPRYGSEAWIRENPNWSVGMKPPQYPERFWEWNIGNGFVSNIENIVMMLCLFFGFMRFIDLMKLFHEEEKAQAWRMFWELCEE
jgi:hypothetical protein